ncbi:hypothetical protein [Nocardia asteroides]|uniref:hypothetical protein n=1 Tax=Nocardia asteroides TaxID=1824 RepID=UPI001E2BB867|nr:hypothetical protein [Nocardia asteroides]UGT59893.1 hypothetical protein LTT61_22070 [Nocardia asteroides]
MTNSHVVKYGALLEKPGSPLAVVRSGFEQIAAGALPTDPRPVPTPESARGGPVRTWAALRERLWDSATPMAEVDAIWVWLLERVRAQDEGAMLVCAGLAAPMLSRTASAYTTSNTTTRHDLESEVLTAFLSHLPRVGLQSPGVWHRLRWGAYRAVLKAATQQRSGATVVGDLDHDLAPLGERVRVRAMVSEPGHPETVLAQAVAAGVISADAAELIAASRWEGRSLTCLAAERGVSLWKLRKQRPRAERALLAWLSDRARDPGRTSTVEAEAVTALAPPDRSPRRGRRPNRHPVTSAQASTEHGQVAA